MPSHAHDGSPEVEVDDEPPPPDDVNAIVWLVGAPLTTTLPEEGLAV